MGISILIVDDDKLLVEKLEETVNWSGIGIDMVFTANNIRQAQKLLEEYPIEMLLCDIDMPQGNGLELLEWIRYKKLDIECTFLSSYANFAYAQMALKLSSREYLLKPISNADLETALRRIVGIVQEKHQKQKKQEKKGENEKQLVLVKFATEDADGDGDPTNEIGITNAAGSGLLSGDLRHILSPFGTMVSRDGNYMGLNGEGKPVFMPMEENYKEAVKWMRQLWEEGVVDPEYFTQDGSMQTAKQQADGGSQVGLIFGWTADAQVGPNVNQFKTLEAVEGYDGNHYVEAATNYLDISDRELMISKDCKDPDTLLKWADEFYTDLASLQTFYGSVGSQITDNGDGTYNVDVPSDGSSLDTSAWSNSLRDFGPKYMNEDFYDKVSLPEDQGDGVKLADDAINEKYVDTEKNCGFPMVQYTDEDLSRITAIGTDIYKYVEAQYAHWVVDGGIDDEWDSYIDQLKAMGIDEFLQIQTDAYNAYKENLAK